MGQRLELQTILSALVPAGKKVYFQPPSNLEMDYPCIVYRRDDATTEFADDAPYSVIKRYQVIVIDRDPDSDIPGKVAMLPMTRFNRYYASDDLNHDVYNIYF